MSIEQPRNEPAFIAAHAGILVPEGRLALFGAGLTATRQSFVAFMRRDFGLAEPASRFCPPPSR